MRFYFAILLAGALLPAQGQVTALSDPVHTSPQAPWAGTKDYYRKVFHAPDTRVTLQAPVKLRDFVAGGKLELSLKGFLELVLANNTDISIQRMLLELPKNAIERAFGIFDPTLNTNFAATRSATPATNQLQGANVVSNLNQPFSARFQQLLPTSTTVFSQFGWTKLSTNDTFAIYNPAYTNTWQSGFTQPLLRGRGSLVTRLPITIARQQRRVQETNFEDTLMRLVVQAENAYWDVISARERIKVQEQALDLADQSLKRAKRELELGATPELEIYQPEQNYATAKIALTQVQFQLRQSEDALRRFMGVDLDPDVRTLPIVLTEKVEPALDEKPFEREDLIGQALKKRPDLRVFGVSLDVNDLQIQTAANSLKPNLNLTGFYQSYGRGGPGYTRPIGLGSSVTPVFVPGGPGDAVSQMLGFNFNTFNFGLTLQLPLRDRRVSADLADAMVQKKLTTLRQRTTEQTIRLEVLNAITQVENSRASVTLAKIALDYAVKRAEADQKRYDLGVINIFFLLAAQSDLTNAQANVVNQTVQYRRNTLTLQQRLGSLLDDKGIVIQ